MTTNPLKMTLKMNSKNETSLHFSQNAEKNSTNPDLKSNLKKNKFQNGITVAGKKQ
jgi:hypothetical protein